MTLATEILGRLLRLSAPLTRGIVVERDLPVPMDDGVVLYADRLAPPGQRPMPTVLVRSPYGRRGIFGTLFGRLVAERGLQVVVQSTRGGFGSGGEFDPFNEREDGLATLRWLRAQAWHAGRVGSMGPSYMGLAQWAVADELDAMTVAVSASEFRGQALGSGAIALDTAMSWLLQLHVQERRLPTLRLLHGLVRTLPSIVHELPLGELDERAFGAPQQLFRRWLDELAPESDWWSSRDFSASVGDVTAPVQLIGGWHDILLPWTIEDWSVLRARGRDPQLVIGPWAHTSGALTAATLREGIAWLRSHLLGDARMLREGAVRVYVTGEDRWRTLPDWPPPGAREVTQYLQPGGGLGPQRPPPSPPDAFRYHPADPTPSVGGALLFEQRPVRDNRPLEARPDVLTYTTTPMQADVDVIGPVRAEIRLRSSLAHTDLFVRVCDVHPDGRSLNVCDGLVRLTPGRPPRDDRGVATVALALWPAAHRFARGHRLRVQVSSGAHPRYARNPGTGEPAATARRLVAADQEVFHDPERPSSVTFSVL